MTGAAEPVRAPLAGDPDAPFWDACRAGRFLLHVCTACGRAYWPASCCVTHGAAAMAWQERRGEGRIETFTVFHRAYRPHLAARLPYVVAVVRLDDGPYFHTNIVGGDWRDVAIGVRAGWIGPGVDAQASKALFRLLPT